MEDIKNGSEVVKYFDGWQVGPFDIDDEDNILYKENNAYSGVVSGSVLTFSGPGLRVRFNLRTLTDPSTGDETSYVTDISGSRYYLLAFDNEIKGYINSTDVGNYGNLSTLNGSPVVTARWASVYDLTVLNDGGLGTTSIWSESGYGKAENQSFNYMGVAGIVGQQSSITKGKELSIKVDNRATSTSDNYPFITNQDFAFFTLDDTKDDSVSNVTSSDNKWFGIYNYGYKLIKWQISFIDTNGIKHYVDLSENGWIDKTTSTSIEVSSLIGKTIGGYAGLLDNLYTAGLNEDIYLTISPVWEAAKINVYEVGIESDFAPIQTVSEVKRSSSTITFNGNYELKSGSAFLGTSFAIFKTKENHVPITHSTLESNKKWNYNNIHEEEFEYKDGVYRLNVISYSVSNIYKVMLNGIKVDEAFMMVVTGSDYDEVVTTRYADDDYYNHAYGYDNATESTTTTADCLEDYKYSQEHTWQNDFSAGLLSKISQYVTDISNGSHKLLRKIYTDDIDNDSKLLKEGKTSLSSVPYVYYAHKKGIGRLPAFKHKNYQLIFWVDDVESYNIYMTDLYNPTEEIGHEQDAYPRPGTDTWELNEDKNNTTFDAHYFRRYYFINPEIRENEIINQVGYLVIDSADKLETDANEKLRYQSTHLAIALKENDTDENYAMHYYDITNFKTGFTLANVEIDGLTVKYNGNVLTETEDGIKIYSGCSVNISVFDQSKDPVAMASEKFDTMIGYKFMNRMSAKEDDSGEVFADYTLINYDCDMVYEVKEGSDIDPIGGALENVNGASITFIFDFTKIEYNLELDIDNADAGNFTLTTPYGEFVDRDYQKVNKLKVGDRITLTYKANPGYDLNADGSVTFIVGGVSGRDFSFDLYEKFVGTDGYTTQVFTFVIDGTWLRVNYYNHADDSITGNDQFLLVDNKTGDDVDGVDLGNMIINTELIEFDYLIKLVDTQGNNIGIIQESDKWDVSQVYLDLSKAVKAENIYGDSANEYIVQYDNINYAMIESYFEQYSGRKTLFNAKYAFPLNTNPVVDRNVAVNLKNILNYGNTIIPLTDRVIRSVIVVEPICEITLKVDDETIAKDAKLTTTLTLSNNSNDVRENSKIYTLSEGSDDTEITILTYKGLNNNIEINNYDEILYDGAIYSNDISSTVYALNSYYNFIVNADEDITFKLNPANHKYNIKYFVNGKEVSSRPSQLKDADPKDLDITTEAPNGYVRIGDVITPYYRSNNNKFSLAIEIGDKKYLADTTTGLIDPITIIRSHLNNSYNFDIKVCLTELSNEDVFIILDLKDSSQDRTGDDYGTFAVNVDNELVYTSKPNEKSVLVHVYAGESLSIDLRLNEGYAYSGYYRSNNSSDIAKNMNGNTLTLAENYDISVGDRTYYVLLEKVENRIEFANSPNKNYSYNVNGKIQDYAVVGDTINLYQLEELQDEIFDYYHQGSGKVKISENVSTSITVSSNTIENEKIYLGVKTEEYYKVKIEMNKTSYQYLKDNEGNKHFIATASFMNIPLNQEVFAPKGKINIEMSAQVETKYQYFYRLDNGEDIEIQENSGKASKEFALEKDLVITITIKPREYKEFRLLESHDGIKVYEGSIVSADYDIIVSDPKITGYSYGKTSSIELRYTNTEYIMTSLEITGNDGNLVKVYIDKEKGLSLTEENTNTTKVTELKEVEKYTIRITDNKIIISYVVLNNLELTIDYTPLINIKPE